MRAFYQGQLLPLPAGARSGVVKEATGDSVSLEREALPIEKANLQVGSHIASFCCKSRPKATRPVSKIAEAVKGISSKLVKFARESVVPSARALMVGRLTRLQI